MISSQGAKYPQSENQISISENFIERQKLGRRRKAEHRPRWLWEFGLKIARDGDSKGENAKRREHGERQTGRQKVVESEFAFRRVFEINEHSDDWDRSAHNQSERECRVTQTGKQPDSY